MIARKQYACSYIDPDADGVCSSIGFGFLMRSTGRGEYSPVVFGTLDNETSFALRYFKVDPPKQKSPEDFEPDCQIALLDTHHIEQLPKSFPYTNVVEIIDHHPAGDVKAFPNATIVNEPVGAVATIITERIKASSISVPRGIAGLLAASVVSNTLNFRAPSAVERDRAAFTWLQLHVEFTDELVQAMLEARSLISGRSTYELLEKACKVFISGTVRYGISQLELATVAHFTSRSDLHTALLRLQDVLKLDHILFNGVDLGDGTSTLVAPEQTTQEVAEQALAVKFQKETAHVNRILLRKTDLVPHLSRVLERRPTPGVD